MRFPHDACILSEVKTQVSHGELHDNIIICHKMAYETQVFRSVKQSAKKKSPDFINAVRLSLSNSNTLK